MSHVSIIPTLIVFVPYLIVALKDLGFAMVESRQRPHALRGLLQGDDVERKAEIVATSSEEDKIGFVKNDQGTYDLLVPESLRDRYGAKWVQSLTQRYAYHVVKDQLENQDFTTVQEEVQPDKTIHLTLRRMA